MLDRPNPPMIEASLWRHMQARDPSADPSGTPIVDCLAVAVSDRARARAPKVEFAGPLPTGVTGSVAVLDQALQAVRGAGRVAGLDWPVCCGALTLLHFANGAGSSLDPAIASGRLDDCVLTEGDLPDPGERAEWQSRIAGIRERTDSGAGMALLRCSTCQRVYGGWVIP